MGTMGTSITAQDLRAHAEIGGLDRMAGMAIQTREQYQRANPTITGEDAWDIYRAYRAGFNRG